MSFTPEVSSELATHEYQSLYDDLGLEFTAQDYTWNFEGVLDYVFAKHLLAKRALGPPGTSIIFQKERMSLSFA